MKREHWKSKLGFMWAAIGSAVGLGSIWRFPYVVGENGGAIFVLLFCVFLIGVSLPIMLSEIMIGRKAQSNPADAFDKLGKTGLWKSLGTMQVITGFLVSIFYSVICSWTLGYFVEALFGNLTNFSSALEAKAFWNSCFQNPWWTISSQVAFLLLSVFVLYAGVQKGIEATNKILMPMLFLFLLFLAVVGLQLPGASKGVEFLLSPDWSMLNGKVALIALGQAFFGLSVGQGTMLTYGSYLRENDNLFKISIPVTFAIVLVSMLAGLAIFTTLFSFGGEVTSGSELIFQALPLVFSSMKFGTVLLLVFFALILFAGLTSQISAMEPFISYLTDHHNFSRHKAVAVCGFLVMLLGIPVSLSYGVIKELQVFGTSLFEGLSFFCVNVLIPLGALSVVSLVAWKNPFSEFLEHIRKGAEDFLTPGCLVEKILLVSIKFVAPLVILIILLNLFL